MTYESSTFTTDNTALAVVGTEATSPASQARTLAAMPSCACGGALSGRRAPGALPPHWAGGEGWGGGGDEGCGEIRQERRAAGICTYQTRCATTAKPLGIPQEPGGLQFPRGGEVSNSRVKELEPGRDLRSKGAHSVLEQGR